ncbi:MAG: hypothetical protein DRH17_12855 [Deltaproteobacteria bacterium]|nr:MAG: hypothetical protein DRH17_12855 [Deltaproteobacteria bacterium]
MSYDKLLEAVVKIIALVCLTVYGLKLAELGIDSQVSMLLGAIMGGIAGYTLKTLVTQVKTEGGRSDRESGGRAAG